MDRGTWQAAVHRVIQSQTLVKRLSMHKLKVSETKISHVSSLIFCISLPEFQVHLHLLLSSVPVFSSIKARVTLTIHMVMI